jgi:hypothetical protein
MSKKMERDMFMAFITQTEIMKCDKEWGYYSIFIKESKNKGIPLL